MADRSFWLDWQRFDSATKLGKSRQIAPGFSKPVEECLGGGGTPFAQVSRLPLQKKAPGIVGKPDLMMLQAASPVELRMMRSISSRASSMSCDLPAAICARPSITARMSAPSADRDAKAALLGRA
jgi:hypothetical protein